MSITVFIDPLNTLKDPSIIHVNTQVEYLKACSLISESIENKDKLSVAVHNKAMMSWFNFLQTYRDVTITICDPIRILSNEIGISTKEIPIELREDPSVIIFHNLVSKANENPKKSDEKFMSWVLRVTLGSIWQNENLLEPLELNSLVRDYLSGKSSSSIHPTIMALRNQRMESWKSSSPFADILRWLSNGNSKSRAESLVLYSFISKYPREVVIEALQFGGRWAELVQLAEYENTVNIIDPLLFLDIEIPPGYNHVINDFLSNSLRRNPFIEVVPFISGYLIEEERTLKQFLIESLNQIGSSWIEPLREIREKFVRVGRSKDFSSFLSRLIPVPNPAKLLLDASWLVVQHWLEKEYYPFYSWCSTVSRIEDTANCVSEFENWLLANYDKITRSDAFAPYEIHEICESLKKDFAVLLVIIDGLSWEYGQVLGQELSNRGLKYLKSSAHITSIPTITATSKPAIVSGQMPGQIIYEDRGTQYYGQIFGDSHNIISSDLTSCSSNEKSLDEAVSNVKRAYLYFFNELDETIHKLLKYEKRREKIEKMLREISENIVDAKKEFESSHHRSLAIIISSDHGFTELPSNGFPIITFASKDNCRIKNGRVAIAGDKCELPENTGSLIRIDKKYLGGSENLFLIPHGYSCIDSKPRGATHGGITPQEVIVPVIVFDPRERFEYRDIEIAISGAVRRGKQDNSVEVVLFNPNNMGAEIKDINIRLVSFPREYPIYLGSNEKCILKASIDGTNLKQKHLNVTGNLLIDIRGEKHVTEVDLNLETIGAAISDQLFEDSFEV